QQMQQQQMMQQQQQLQQQQIQQQQMQQMQQAQQAMQQQSMQQMQQGGQQQMMQPGQPQMQQQQMVGQPMQPGQMMAMGPQGQMMMQGQQPYGYPQQGQQWPPQAQMMPPNFVRKPTMMGAMPGGGGAPPQRVMIQRVPYPATPGYPQGAMPQQPGQQLQQQQMPPGAQYAARPMPPQYPQGVGQPGGQPPPGYGYPPGTVPMPVQSPVPYPGGSTVPPGGMQMAPGGGVVTPQYPQQQRQPVQQQQQQPGVPQQQQLPMRPYMQSPQGTQQQQQQMMVQGQQPVYPQSAQPPQQQQQQPGTPQPPFTPNAARYPSGTPTNSSPLHGQQQQLLQQQQAAAGVGGPPGTPGTPVQQQQLAPDMRSPQLMSPSQAQMMQQAQAQQQPMMHPTARQMSNGDMHMRPVPQQQQPVPVQMQQPMQPMQQMVLAPPPVQHTGGPYVTRDGGMHNNVFAARPDMVLVGCHIIVLDWERYTTERTDQLAIKQMVRSLGGEIDFGPKAYENQRPVVTHGIISYLTVPTPRPSHIEQALMMMLKDNKRIVTMQWLIDTVESRQLQVPGRLAHLPVPMPLDSMRANHGRIISVAGFADSERGAVKYMVEAIGAKMMPGLTQNTHLLVAKNPSSEKFEKAREWGVPTVNLQWLCDAYLGHPSRDLEHPRYQVSQVSPIDVHCGTYTLEQLHENYKHCLAAWRLPIPCNDEIWNRAEMVKRHMDGDEHVYPLKRLKISSSPAPTEEEIAAAHAADPPSPDRKEIIVAFEGLDEELETAFGRKIRMLGGGVTSAVEKCSHLVAVDGKRTVTLLKALALGKNIVSPGWVNCSYELKKFADTLDFFLRDEEQEKMHNCNFKLSVMRARKAGAFEDCELYITPSVDPSPEVVRSICELAGGIVHSHPPSPAKIIECIETDKPFILVATECDMPILKYLTDAGCTVYSTELIFTAVMRQEVEIHASYVVAPTACQPAPLRLPPLGGGQPATPARRTSTGYATPPGVTPVALTPTQGGPVEFASPHTPRVRAN
ncbi:hypothetical protein PENTCL1PPCAC_15859, partial [Pristionchus entomophagus]